MKVTFEHFVSELNNCSLHRLILLATIGFNDDSTMLIFYRHGIFYTISWIPLYDELRHDVKSEIVYYVDDSLCIDLDEIKSGIWINKPLSMVEYNKNDYPDISAECVYTDMVAIFNFADMPWYISKKCITEVLDNSCFNDLNAFKAKIKEKLNKD